jgi:tRNA dimethylallyltransferase
VGKADYWIAGCTASGKSAVALELAQFLAGEIVSADSMQVYRGLDRGTAKPSLADRRRAPHHLIDLVDLTEPFTASLFVERARACLKELAGRGRIAILCGGTGLYFKALLEGLGPGPAPDPQLRAELEETRLESLLAELRQRDPAAYAAIDRRNPRRVVRAVEVLRLGGGTWSDRRAGWSRAAGWKQPRFYWLVREDADLRQRINTRVDRMFADGLGEETRRLLDQGLARNRTALQAIGYRQVVEHLEGMRGLDETVALVKSRTWQLARRQRNWFRNQLAAEPVAVAADEHPAETARKLMARAVPRPSGN